MCLRFFDFVTPNIPRISERMNMAQAARDIESSSRSACDTATFVSWNIQRLTTNNKEWCKRKQHIVSSLRAFSPDFITIQEVCSGKMGKAAVAEIADALRASRPETEWRHCVCDIRGDKSGPEQIAFLWREDHPMFRGRPHAVATLSLAVKNQPLNWSTPGLNISLRDIISVLTNGRICSEQALQRQEAEIQQGLACDGFTPHEISTWNFDRLPALISFPAGDNHRPPLHVLSFHLSTGKTADGCKTRQQEAEVHLLQRLMMVAWHNDSCLIAMGDHNAQMADNPAVWDTDAVLNFTQCSQRFIPPTFCTNRFPYIYQETGAQRNDDIFCGPNVAKLWAKVGTLHHPSFTVFL